MADTSNRILSITALVSALVAIGMFTYQSFSSRSLLEATDRIYELEREVALLQGNVFPDRESLGGEGGLDSEASPVVPPYPSAESGNFERDIEEIRWAMTVRGFMPATQEHIERSEKLIFDAGQNAESKLVAARVLRRAGRLGDAEVREMIAAFHFTDKFHVQASILEVMDGVTTPELAPTLLKVSAESSSSRVRRQAIDTMSGFLPDPELEDWLRYVNKNDSDRRVRDEASRLLEKFVPVVNE